MSAHRVDVLAVLDHIADCDYIPVSTADLNATRAAVAELIEAHRLLLAQVDAGTSVDYRALQEHSIVRRSRAALVNVGSAS